MLIEFLDENQKNLAPIYFKVLFMDHFYFKFDDCLQNLMMKIQGAKFFKIENYSLMHYLNAPNVLEIERDFSFKFY